MQLTLLQIVQDMLSAIKAESVSTVVSGSTTEDALLCVNIANREYENLLYKYKWKNLRSYTSLSAGASLNILKGASTVIYIDTDSVWYGSVNNENRVYYIDPEEFVRRTINRDTTQSNVTVINNLKIYNDTDPTFFTSFDDINLVFDAMPTGAGLVASNSKALVYTAPTARKSVDADVFSLPIKIYPYFRNLCVGYAQKELESEVDEGEKTITRAWREIAKVTDSGNLVVKDTDYRRHIRVRHGSALPRTTNVTSI